MIPTPDMIAAVPPSRVPDLYSRLRPLAMTDDIPAWETVAALATQQKEKTHEPAAR